MPIDQDRIAELEKHVARLELGLSEVANLLTPVVHQAAFAGSPVVRELVNAARERARDAEQRQVAEQRADRAARYEAARAAA